MPAISIHTGKLYRLSLLAIVGVSLLSMLQYLEYFPNGWDQAEYSWAIRDNHLPHSPYILFFLLGKLIHQLIPNPASALALLSMASGLIALLLYYHCNQRLQVITDGRSDGAWQSPNAALPATLLLGLNYLFIRQASSQEIYVVLLAFSLLTVALLLSRAKHRAALAGLAFGCAFAVHNASVFLLPALLFLVWIRAENGPASLFGFTLGAATVIAALAIWLYLNLYRPPGIDPVNAFITYLRGISPGLDFAKLSDLSYLYQSSCDLVWRLVNRNTPQLRGPLATMPVAIAWFHLVLAIPAYLLLARINWRAAVFMALWSSPYLCYEILLGRSPDYGVYIVFVLPTLFAVLALLIASLAGSAAGRHQRYGKLWPVLAIALLGLLLLPSVSQLSKNREGLHEDALWHFTAPVLAAIAASSELPQDAIVIQHRYEWNVNLLPYYAQRRHILRKGDRLFLFKHQGAFAPLDADASEPLTTDMLRALLASGRPVYAFDSNPIRKSNPALPNPEMFRWSAALVVDLERAKRELGLDDELSEQLAGGHYTLYRAELAAQ